MSAVPTSPFSAGAPTRAGRELTAAEERHFERRRRQATATLVGVVALVPLLGGLMFWAMATLPFTDRQAPAPRAPHIVAGATEPEAAGLP